MKYLGIDYGSKRIGVAVSDESGAFAFPKHIVSSGMGALVAIMEIIQTEGIQKIVVGNSMDQKGMRNDIMHDVDTFVEELHNLTGLPVVLSDERFSSSAARAATWQKPVATPHRSGAKPDRIDDQAAAIMLQRYLDKQS